MEAHASDGVGIMHGVNKAEERSQPWVENSWLLCLKFVKIREFYEIVKTRKNSFYNITSNCKVFEFAQH